LKMFENKVLGSPDVGPFKEKEDPGRKNSEKDPDRSRSLGETPRPADLGKQVTQNNRTENPQWD